MRSPMGECLDKLIDGIEHEHREVAAGAPRT